MTPQPLRAPRTPTRTPPVVFDTRAGEQWAALTHEWIERFEAWNLCGWREHPDLGYNDLTLAGLWRWRFFKNGSVEVFQREIASGAWRSCLPATSGAPDIQLGMSDGLPRLRGAKALEQAFACIAAVARAKISNHPEFAEVDWNSEAMRADHTRLHRHLHREVYRRGKHLAIGWRMFARRLWSQLDRPAVSLMLAARWRKPLKLTDYLLQLPTVDALRRVAAIDRNLLPWIERFDLKDRGVAAEGAARAVCGEPYTLPEVRLQLSLEEAQDGWVRHDPHKTPCEPLAPTDLIGVPFSIAWSACGRMDSSHQAPFLAAWRRLPAEVRRRSAWMGPFLAADHLGSWSIFGSWSMGGCGTGAVLWGPMMRVILDAADADRRKLGYRAVSTLNWRCRFWERMRAIQTHWRSGDLGAEPRLQIEGEDPSEWHDLLPEGSDRARLEARCLERWTVRAVVPTVEGTVSDSEHLTPSTRAHRL